MTSMRLETVPLDLLISIEPALHFEQNMVNMFKHFDRKRFGRIPVVGYSAAGIDKFIMGDGHHRAAYCYLTQQQANIEILETDREVYGKIVGAFSYFERIETFISAYLTVYKVGCDENNVYSIEDMVRNQARINPNGIVARKLQLLDSF